MNTVSVIIPTFNAGSLITEQINRVLSQTIKPDEIIIIDSTSTDDTKDKVLAFHSDIISFVQIPQIEFDHGATRDKAIRLSKSDFFLLLTQDALPYNDRLIESMLHEFKDEKVGAVNGRQLAYDDAYRFEKEVRRFRYPAVYRKWDKNTVFTSEINRYQISDVCAMYRKSSYMELGGFPHPLRLCEDILMAKKLIEAGYCLVYSPNAAVYHSHNLTPLAQYKRNYDIGYFMASSEEFRGVNPDGEGFNLVKTVSIRLLSHLHFISFIAFGIDCFARLLGNRRGKHDGKRQALS